MFTFGFGDVIDRLEKHFGTTATRIVLSIFVGAILISTLAYVVKESLYPFILWLGSIWIGVNPDLAAASRGSNLLALGMSIFGVALISVGIFSVLKSWSISTKALSESKAIADKSRIILDESMVIRADLITLKDQIFTEARAELDTIFASAKNDISTEATEARAELDIIISNAKALAEEAAKAEGAAATKPRQKRTKTSMLPSDPSEPKA